MAHSPLFSKRHYEWLAAYWRQRHNHMENTAWRSEIVHMAAALKREQQSFIIVRFLQACGLTRSEANRLLEGHMQ